MSDSAPVSRLAWTRPRPWVPFVLGLSGLLSAVGVALYAARPVEVRFTMSAGAEGTTRFHVARALVDEVTARGAEAQVVVLPEASDEVAAVNDGTIDLALVSGVYHMGAHQHIREVGPLYLEALHLLVRADLADAVTRDLGTLRDHTVETGPTDSESDELARMVLAFTGIGPRQLVNGAYDALDRDLRAGDVAALPDAIFRLGIVPSRVALPIIAQAGYRLVPLPFADAMRLRALAGTAATRAHEIDWQYITDAVIPAFTYSTQPPVPPEPLHTVGSRLILIANEAVPDASVELILDTVFRSRFARLAEPPLDPSVLHLPPRIHQHPGTAAYVQRNQPLITSDSVDTMSNLLSILGAVVGGSLFLFQWRRQRTAAKHDEVFGSYLSRAADIERRLAALELRATLDLPQLITLQRQVLEVKTEALERFAAGELGSQTSLSQLLAPLNATREHIGDLLLHVREDVADRAAAEGRSEQAAWREAAKPSDDSSTTS
jgi:TRAP-type uncharacterized transport system substrate-binding protein